MNGAVLGALPANTRHSSALNDSPIANTRLSSAPLAPKGVQKLPQLKFSKHLARSLAQQDCHNIDLLSSHGTEWKPWPDSSQERYFATVIFVLRHEFRPGIRPCLYAIVAANASFAPHGVRSDRGKKGPGLASQSGPRWSMGFVLSLAATPAGAHAERDRACAKPSQRDARG